MNRRPTVLTAMTRILAVSLSCVLPVTFLSVAAADVWANGFGSVLLQVALAIAGLVLLVTAAARLVPMADNLIDRIRDLRAPQVHRGHLRSVAPVELPPYAAAVMA